jgi:trans-aconitate 2-methyltransferase
MSTIPLRGKWPLADIVGADNSESMLDKAKELSSSIQWIQRDCSKPLIDLGKFDLVFSNAALQWFENQDKVINNLSSILTTNGLLAMQIPYFSEMTINNCIKEVVDSYEGNEFDGLENELGVCFSPEFYYKELTKYFSNIQLWQTSYYHIMDKHEDILDFYKSTGLRPYTERLKDKKKEEFLSNILEEIRKQYAIQTDGKLLFEFKRIFFIAS